jgi:hypothetical protein
MVFKINEEYCKLFRFQIAYCLEKRTQSTISQLGAYYASRTIKSMLMQIGVNFKVQKNKFGKQNPKKV